MTTHHHCLRHRVTNRDAFLCCICLRTILRVWAFARKAPMGPVCKAGQQ